MNKKLAKIIVRQIIESNKLDITTAENKRLLKNLLYFLYNLSKFYVFGKEWWHKEDFCDITYYHYFEDEPNDEKEYLERIYEYQEFFLEVHGEPNDEEKGYPERYILYANNGCDRGCCGTWEMINYLD